MHNMVCDVLRAPPRGQRGKRYHGERARETNADFLILHDGRMRAPSILHAHKTFDTDSLERFANRWT